MKTNCAVARKLLAGITLLLLTAIFTYPGDYIWIEGESPRSSTMKKHSWYSGQVKKSELSGGDFLSHFAPGTPPEAEFTFMTDVAGEYSFWARMNPVAVPSAQYRLNTDKWTEIDFKNPQDQINIANNNTPDMRFIAWLNLGKVKLAKGKNTIRFRFNSKNNHHGNLDCFLLTTGDFVPNGLRKPGEKLGLADVGMWPFEPTIDQFSKDSLLDLSHLNSPIKNSTPFISMNKNGEFTSGNEVIRFWSVNTYAQNKLDMDRLKHHGRWLAKRGVNLVRWHGHLMTDKMKEPTKAEDVAPKELDACFKLVAAMRSNGIYTCISPYWATSTSNKKSWGFTHIGNNNLAAVLFWDKKVQQAYKAQLRKLYTTINPYTGIALKDDPAVAIIQLQNEDSMLFWTMQSVKGAVLDDLMKMFGDFATKKYGSINKAFAAWDGIKNKYDDPAAGKLGLSIIWEMTQKTDGGKQKRLSDQFQFYVETMRKFNSDMADYLRNDLGCKQVINAGNWRTASESRMLDAERYAYATNEVIGVNRYKSVVHTGSRNGYLISKDDTYRNSSALLNPLELPVAVKQVKGKAMIIPESNWVPPEEYQSEGPVLTAAYSLLSGVDSLIWFCQSSMEWGKPYGKWDTATPMIAGQFPAAALIFRKGYIKHGEPVVEEERTLDELWQRKESIICESQAYDPNRDSDLNPQSPVKSPLNPLAFLVGPVEITYGDRPENTRVTNLGKYIDTKSRTVKSNTGQLELDYGRGIFLMDSPQAQGAAGWLSKEKEIVLSDIIITSENEYATVVAVSLDGKPLKSAKQILVQIGTYNRPYGFKQSPASIKQKNRPARSGFKITDVGMSLWNIEKAKGSITVNNPSIREAVVLDENGMPVRNIKTVRNAGRMSFTLPQDALYVVLR